jgi:hypothetical protein
VTVGFFDVPHVVACGDVGNYQMRLALTGIWLKGSPFGVVPKISCGKQSAGQSLAQEHFSSGQWSTLALRFPLSVD